MRATQNTLPIYGQLMFVLTINIILSKIIQQIEYINKTQMDILRLIYFGTCALLIILQETKTFYGINFLLFITVLMASGKAIVKDEHLMQYGNEYKHEFLFGLSTLFVGGLYKLYAELMCSTSCFCVACDIIWYVFASVGGYFISMAFEKKTFQESFEDIELQDLNELP